MKQTPEQRDPKERLREMAGALPNSEKAAILDRCLLGKTPKQAAQHLDDEEDDAA